MLANTRPSPRRDRPVPPGRTTIHGGRTSVRRGRSWRPAGTPCRVRSQRRRTPAAPRRLAEPSASSASPDAPTTGNPEAVLDAQGTAHACGETGQLDRTTRSPRPRSARAPSRTELESEPEMVIVTPSGHSSSPPADELMRVGPPFGSTNRWIEAFGSRKTIRPWYRPRNAYAWSGWTPSARAREDRVDGSSPATRPGTPHACA